MTYAGVLTTVYTRHETVSGVAAGLPFLSRTRGGKHGELRGRYDTFHTTLMDDPRGHADLFGAIVSDYFGGDSYQGRSWDGLYRLRWLWGDVWTGLRWQPALIGREEPEADVPLDTRPDITRLLNR
jgi:hypothetical protein